MNGSERATPNIAATFMLCDGDKRTRKRDIARAHVVVAEIVSAAGEDDPDERAG